MIGWQYALLKLLKLTMPNKLFFFRKFFSEGEKISHFSKMNWIKHLLQICVLQLSGKLNKIHECEQYLSLKRHGVIHSICSSICELPLNQPVMKQTQLLNHLACWRFLSPKEIKTHAQNLLHSLVLRPQARKRQWLILTFQRQRRWSWSPRRQCPLRLWTHVPNKRISPLHRFLFTYSDWISN